MSLRPLSFFVLSGSRDLGEAVATRLALAIASHEERDFEDGEHKSRPLQDVCGHDVFVLHNLHGDETQSGNDKLCRLLFFCGALRDAGAARVTVIAPYLCYARKDRRTKPNDPITTRYVASLFEAMQIDVMITVEVHNLAAFENAFRCRTLNIDTMPLFAAYYARHLHGLPAVAVSPDTGGAKRAEQFRQALEERTGRAVGSAYMEKFRSAGIVSGDILAGDVRDKVAIIVDDLIASGSTLLRAAKACRTAGAEKIYTAATHGLFTGGAPVLLGADEINGIAVTNVLPFRRSDIAARLTVIDASDEIAQSITAVHGGP